LFDQFLTLHVVQNVLPSGTSFFPNFSKSEMEMDFTKRQESFDNMKGLTAKETLPMFPDFTQEFEIHTDGKLQLGA
jgi:hypothetical protein